MTLELERVVDKVKKCLALSQSSNENEAATALRQAQKLMEMYNLTEEGILGAEIGELLVKCPSAWTKPPQWEINLMAALCKAFGGKFMLRHGCKGVLAQFVYIGLKQNAPMVEYAYQVVRRQAANARSRYLAGRLASRGEKIAAGETFCRAFIQRTAEQIHAFAMTPELQKVIESKVAAMSLGVYAAAKRNTDYHALEAGRKAGANASLHRPMPNAGKGVLAISSKGGR